MFQYFTFGVGEYYRGIFISAQVKQLQRYIHSLKVQHRAECLLFWGKPGKPKGGQFQSLLFSLILQPVSINKPGAPLLGLAKSIYQTDIISDSVPDLAHERKSR